MLNHMKLRLEGKHHSGIDDCNNSHEVEEREVETGR